MTGDTQPPAAHGYGEFSRCVPLLILRDHLSSVLNYAPCTVTILLPPDLLPGITTAWGHPVERADGPPRIALTPTGS